MAGANDIYRPAKDRRKKAPVKRVVLSPEAQQSYEALVREKDERDRTYSRHLVDPGKTK